MACFPPIQGVRIDDENFRGYDHLGLHGTKNAKNVLVKYKMFTQCLEKKIPCFVRKKLLIFLK